MKTKSQQNQNNIISNPAWNRAPESCNNQANHGGSRQDIEKATTSSETCSLPRNQHHRVEDNSEEVKSTTLSRPICVQSAVDNGMSSDFNSMEMFFDGPWRSPASSDLASMPDAIERKLSSESIDSEFPPSSLDDAPSLDDVFDVLDEMDPFESDLTMNAPLSVSSTQLMSQLYWSDSLYRPPSGLNACNPFQPFNFGLVKNLQNPSRGLITAMRRLSELLSKPRSDHLESVFVRLLNNTLNEMEDAAQPQSKRPRRTYERLPVSKKERKRPNKSTSDAESRFESANIGMSRARTSKSHSLPVISTRVGRRTETVDLTGCEECEEQQQHDSEGTQKEPFIALEDTMSAFIGSFFSKSLSNKANNQETWDKLDDFIN